MIDRNLVLPILKSSSSTVVGMFAPLMETGSQFASRSNPSGIDLAAVACSNSLIECLLHVFDRSSSASISTDQALSVSYRQGMTM